VELFPHQAALLKTYFDPASERVILLRGDVALGKTVALVALTAQLLQERPTARVLVLAPAALGAQFARMFSEANTRCLLVDRYQFREMRDSTADGEFWPRGMVSVLSLDFAKLPDILDRLTEARWDLVIVDDVHRSMTGRRSEVLRRVGGSAQRLVLATASDVVLTDVFPGEMATTVEWQRNRIVHYDGTLLDTLPPPLLHEVSFTLLPAELSLLDTMEDLFSIRKVGLPHSKVIAESTLRCFQSSPAALEHSLQRLSEGLQAPSDLDEPLGELTDGGPEGGSDVQTDQSSQETVAEIAKRALRQMEEIGGDSKLNAFGKLLGHINEGGMPFGRICVVTEYLDTLYYLGAEIEDRGIVCQLLHGDMAAEDRRRAWAMFDSDAGILVATTVGIAEAHNFAAVTDLVLYDLPRSKIALQQVLGRFDRFGRQSRLNVHVLKPSNFPHGFPTESFGLLQELLGSSHKGQPPE
jgi:superfamily II DNA or RNA helicase